MTNEIARLAKPIAGLLLKAGMTDCTVLVSAGKVGLMRGLYAADIIPGDDRQRDLFSDMGEPLEAKIERATESWKGVDVDKFMADIRDPEEPETDIPAEPKRRTYQRNGRRMTEALMVDTHARIGKAQGYCSRCDIERSLVRLTGRTREDVRDAVNRIAERMQITCVKSNSYRYYPRSLRDKIIDMAMSDLEVTR